MTDAADQLLDILTCRNLHLSYVLETHLHADHLTAAAYLRSITGAPVAMGKKLAETIRRWNEDSGAAAVEGAVDLLLSDGESLSLGSSTIRVMATPGHTACSVCYLAGAMAFVGDTLLMPDIGTGRTDFPGGDARTLYRSVRRILALSPQTRLLVGHDYVTGSRDRTRWETTVAEQARENMLVREGICETEFVAARVRRDRELAPPRLLAVAVPANLRGGVSPDRS
jgi:glyoxylase-like metal-dependent hydrolase (beta-lactamase superfamily II)